MAVKFLTGFLSEVSDFAFADFEAMSVGATSDLDATVERGECSFGADVFFEVT